MTTISRLLERYPKANYVDIYDNCGSTFSFVLDESDGEWKLEDITDCVDFGDGFSAITNIHNDNFEPSFDEIGDWEIFTLDSYDEDGDIRTVNVCVPLDFEALYNKIITD